MEEADRSIIEGIAAEEEREKRRTGDDLLVDVTFRYVRRAKADEIIEAAAKINGRVQVSMQTTSDQIIRRESD